nr:GTP-binding protein [Bacillus benzoevorans]
MKTYVHSFSQPIDGQLFANFLRALPDNIYRIKGYVRFNGDPKTYLFQYAYGMPIHTASGLKMKTILVFIGDELDHEGLQKALSELEKNSREMPL